MSSEEQSTLSTSKAQKATPESSSCHGGSAVENA